MALQRLNEPPASKSSYVIPQLEGEILTIPGSKGVFRMLTSAKQTDGSMSVFQSDGVVADAPGFHYHNQAHDIFIVSKGFLKLWNGDRCLIMGPGDFASVPPKIIHNPETLGPFTQSYGVITPGDWVDFFRHVGEPFNGLLIPENDTRNLKALLIPKVMPVKDKFDVVFCRDYDPPAVGEWTASDERLPDSVEPYYLKANTGPRWMLGSVMSRPFITTKQNGGVFSISSIESSSTYGKSVFARMMSWRKVHHVFAVLEGVLAILIEGDKERHLVREGETAMIPAGQAFSLEFESKYVRVWSFASGDGVESLVHRLGTTFEGFVLPDQVGKWDETRLGAVCEELSIDLES